VNWADALTLAEIMANRFLNVGKEWDLHDWQAEEFPEGLRFWRINPDYGTVTTIVVRAPENGEESAPPPVIRIEDCPVEMMCS
jgi:hypothetical protein